MIMDALNLFSSAQTFTTGSENGVKSSSSIDLGVARDIGNGTPLYIVIQVATTQVATSADVTYVDLITDDNPGLNSAAVVRRLCTIPANSVAGTQIIVALPIEGSEAYQRYIGLLYTSYDHEQTAGALTAFITTSPDKYKAYANGFDIATS
jgi:hypothetical protein